MAEPPLGYLRDVRSRFRLLLLGQVKLRIRPVVRIWWRLVEWIWHSLPYWPPVR